MSFGASLKRERELRGISLEEISESTKISIRLLEAIECDHHQLLPGGIFRKAFIKSYARYLGMDEDKVLQEYFLTAETVSPPSIAEEKFDLEKTVTTFLSQNMKSAIGITIALIVVGLSFWFFGESGGNHATVSPDSKRPLPRAASEPSPPSFVPNRPAGSSPLGRTFPVAASKASPIQKATTPPVPSAAELKVLGERAKKRGTPPAVRENPVLETAKSGELSKPGLMLGIDATEQCWLSVRSSDSPLYAGILQSEQSKQFSLQKPLRLTVGNAGGVRLSINGKPFATLGKPGEVRVIEITPANYQAYLAPRQHQ